MSWFRFTERWAWMPILVVLLCRWSSCGKCWGCWLLWWVLAPGLYRALNCGRT